MVEIKKTEEYKQLVEDVSQSTAYHYKASLQKFCVFCEMSPSELIKEAKEYEPDTGKPWLSENPADKKLKDWHKHLINPTCPECGGEVEEKVKNCPNCGSEFEKPHVVSRSSAQTYWRHIKAFYKKFGFDVTAKTPKGTYKNERPDYDAQDVWKMVNEAKDIRDKAIIALSFQGGLNPSDICNLDYGNVKKTLVNENYPEFIWTERQKTEVQYHFPLGEDAGKLLSQYVERRKSNGAELNDDTPLFVKQNNHGRIETWNIQDIMRRVNDRVGDQIEEASKVKSNINPLSLKYLRRAFSIACKNENVDSEVRNYWMGHQRDGNYHGAYEESQISKERQREEYKKVHPRLSIFTTGDEIDEVKKELREDARELKEDVGEQVKQIKELKKENEELKDFRESVRKDYASEVSNEIRGRIEFGVIKPVEQGEGKPSKPVFGETSLEEINEELADKLEWYNKNDEWIIADDYGFENLLDLDIPKIAAIKRILTHPLGGK